MLSQKENVDKLTPIEVHDMICHIADAVLAGGIRRAALISLFSADDEDMIAAKTGNWWETNPQRGRANNSVCFFVTRLIGILYGLVGQVKASGAGEPGFYFSNDKDWEQTLVVRLARPFQFCNLTEVNVSNVESQEDLNERVKAATFIGTLQASYTDFLSSRCLAKNNRKGYSLVYQTGIASGAVLALDMKEAANCVKEENARVAELIGIKPAARTTCVKPAGTTSLTLGTSSGIHAWHNDYYIRRVRVGKNEPIYAYFAKSSRAY